ncbi:MAG: hypothetical protein H6773_00450 [Pseudomonadales bacterium]|nr:hypothetical protein [Pseudomonadales bacterium]
MKKTYDSIMSLLSTGLGERLSIDPSRITYESKNDPGLPVEGHIVGGVRETIQIPDEYMNRANASNATEFLNWLASQ